MNHAQAAPRPGKPPLFDTGQYTISVSKKGTGEGEEPITGEFTNRLELTVSFTTVADHPVPIPNACRIDVRRDDVDYGFDQEFAFGDSTTNTYSAPVDITLAEGIFQPTWWVDIYLKHGNEGETYALSAYLSTLITHQQKVSWSYAPATAAHRDDG